ncbi:MAG: hypothetical protein J5766_05225 [Clostridia bacterium]|nr:hypothetical protein [Clostridia bacterium]
MAHRDYFYRIYFGVLAGFALIIIIGLAVLHSVLKTYEAAQPKVVAQKICDDYIITGKLWMLKDKCELNISDYETKENIEKTFSELVSGKEFELNYSSQIPKGSDICYMVKSGDENYFSIALVKNKKKGKYGIKGYTVNNVAVIKDIYKSVEINFPSSAKVTVNGTPLSEKDIEDLPLPKINDFEFGEDAVHPCRASISGLLNEEVDVKVTTEGFEIQKVDNEYSVSQVFDETLKNEIQEFAIKGVEVYAAHMQDDVGIGAMNKYFDTSSDFYKNVRSTLTNFALNHDSADYADIQCGEFQKYTDTIYSCRIKFTHVLKLRDKVYKDYFDKRVFLRIDDKGKKIIDMQSVASAQSPSE